MFKSNPKTFILLIKNLNLKNTKLFPTKVKMRKKGFVLTVMD